MATPISEMLRTSFDQAARRGIPASEIIAPLATKFKLRPERVIKSLVASNQIHATEFCGTTIVWHASTEKAATENTNMHRQISADLLQAGVNLGLANGGLERQALQSTAPEKILCDLIPQILKIHRPFTATTLESPSPSDGPAAA